MSTMVHRRTREPTSFDYIERTRIPAASLESLQAPRLPLCLALKTFTHITSSETLALIAPVGPRLCGQTSAHDLCCTSPHWYHIIHSGLCISPSSFVFGLSPKSLTPMDIHVRSLMLMTLPMFPLCETLFAYLNNVYVNAMANINPDTHEKDWASLLPFMAQMKNHHVLTMTNCIQHFLTCGSLHIMVPQENR